MTTNRISTATQHELHLSGDISLGHDLAASLVAAGILSAPELLERTVIELADECEYLLTSTTVSDLTTNQKTVRVQQLYDGKERHVERSQFLRELTSSPTFDQLRITERA